MYKGRGREKKRRNGRKRGERGRMGPLPAPHPAVLQRTKLCLVPSAIKECLYRPESSCSTQTNLNRQLKNTRADMSLNDIGKCN